MNSTTVPACVVTGGASGLGRSTAILMARRGHPVGVWDIDETGITQTVEACRALGVQAHGQVVDVRDRDAQIAAAAATREVLGGIGSLVACAGVVLLGALGDDTPEAWERSFGINVDGAKFSIDAVLPMLRESGAGASIVVVSSTEGLRGAPFHVGYTSSKHAAIGLARSAAQALGPTGIRVNAVCPGTMDTPMFQFAMTNAPEGTREALEAGINLGYVAPPEEVANVIAFLLSSEAAYVHGATIVVDGGLLTS